MGGCCRSPSLTTRNLLKGGGGLCPRPSQVSCSNAAGVSGKGEGQGDEFLVSRASSPSVFLSHPSPILVPTTMSTAACDHLLFLSKTAYIEFPD